MQPDTIEAARFLIVDDEILNVTLLEMMLERWGCFNVVSTTDPRKALSMFCSSPPDIVLLDLMMPELDGFAVMRQLSPLIPADSYLPILMLTADTSVETKRRALAAGAKDFLTKPFDAVELSLRVRTLLQTRFLHLRLEEQKKLLEARVESRTRELEQAKLAAEELAELRHEQAVEAQVMSAVSLALSGTLEPTQLYAVILAQAARVLPFDGAEIVLYEDGWAVCAASLGEPSVAVGTRLVAVDTTTTTWQVLAQGKVACLTDTALAPDWPATAHGPDARVIRSVLIVPLLIDGDILGSFEVTSFTPRLYGDRHIRIATLIGERATLAVRNARLYAGEQARARAAEDLANMRSDFVAAVSHELRTPLTSIIGYSELLLARWERTSDAKRRDRVAQIIQAANRQKRLVDDLLLVSKLDSSTMLPRSVALPLAAIVGQAVADVQSTYPGQAVALKGAPNVQVHVDGVRAYQILANLLDNAAKYSPADKPITVRWAQDGEMVVVRVVDQGSGVPEDGRGLLFTRFGRVPGSRMRAGHVGTGLGLYLSRQMAQAMGGALDLENTGPGGSTFCLRLQGVAA